jgi:Domain of unknown function (DUF4783)
MKYIITTLLLLSFTFVQATRIDDDDKLKTKERREDNELADRIKMSFKSGNPKMLASCLNNQVELVIDSEKIDFPKVATNQAEMIFKSFFQKNPPLSFSYVYQGSSNAELRYSVANYRSRNKDFLVYILVRRLSGSKYVIETLQFREG